MGSVIYFQKILKKLCCCILQSRRSRIGKSYQSDESVNIPLEEIFRICEFGVTNAYFVLNKLFFSNFLDVLKEDWDHLGAAWLFAFTMSISSDAAFMIIWLLCFSLDILMTFEQLLVTDHQT